MMINTGDEIYLRGQTGTALDGSKQYGSTFTPEDAAEQADVAIRNAATLLEEAGGTFDDVAKLHVYIRDLISIDVKPLSKIDFFIYW